MLRGSVLAAAILVNFPVLWSALIDQSVAVDTALIRLLITVPIVAVLLGLLRAAAKKPTSTRRSARPARTSSTAPRPE